MNTHIINRCSYCCSGYGWWWWWWWRDDNIMTRRILHTAAEKIHSPPQLHQTMITGTSIPHNTLEQGPPSPSPSPPFPSLPFLPLPSPPLRSRPPLLRLEGLGSALAPPAGPGRAPPTNGIWWISG